MAFSRMILYLQLLFDEGVLLIIPSFMSKWVRQHSIHVWQHHGNFVVHIFVFSFLLRSSSKPKAISQKKSSYPQRMAVLIQNSNVLNCDSLIEPAKTFKQYLSANDNSSTMGADGYISPRGTASSQDLLQNLLLF